MAESKKVSDDKLKKMSGGTAGEIAPNQTQPGGSSKPDLTKGNQTH